MLEVGTAVCTLSRVTAWARTTWAVPASAAAAPAPSATRLVNRVISVSLWVVGNGERSGTAGIGPDHVDGLLGHHHDGRVGVAGHQRRHRRAVDDAQPIDAAHAQALVEHGHRVDAHLAGAARMEDRGARVAAELEQV